MLKNGGQIGAYTNILGIDPGLNGALALYNPIDNKLIEVVSMPLTKDEKTGKNSIDPYLLAEIVKGYSNVTRFCVVEQVHAMPNQGVVSMFNFGKSFGLIVGIIASFKMPMYFIQPAVWKSCLSLTSNKADSITLARKHFGDGYFTKKSDDGKAEAALLAYFGKRFYR